MEWQFVWDFGRDLELGFSVDVIVRPMFLRIGEGI